MCDGCGSTACDGCGSSDKSCEECGRARAVLVLGAPVSIDALLAWAARYRVSEADADAAFSGSESEDAAPPAKRARRCAPCDSDDDDDEDDDTGDRYAVPAVLTEDLCFALELELGRRFPELRLVRTSPDRCCEADLGRCAFYLCLHEAAAPVELADCVERLHMPTCWAEAAAEFDIDGTPQWRALLTYV